jgi:hypothetical protein
MEKRGRPTKYKENFIDKAQEYIDLHQDITNEDKKLIVKIPTIEGFARFIEVTKPTLYDWEEKHKDFSYALEHIRVEQKERLLNMGLSGDYNPTIAKLILSSNHGMKEKSDVTSDDKPIQGNTITFKDYGSGNK